MTLDDALFKLALKIHNYCNPESIYCIVPAKKDSRLSHYVIHEELKATHYKREWFEPGKSVKLTFFTNKLYAPITDLGEPDFERIVNISHG